MGTSFVSNGGALRAESLILKDKFVSTYIPEHNGELLPGKLYYE